MTDLTLEDLIKVINERADYWIDLYSLFLDEGSTPSFSTIYARLAQW